LIENGQTPENLETCGQMIIVMASLYQFHHDLYRVLEGSPKFFEVIADWCTGGSPDHRELKDVERLISYDKASGTVTTLHRDPARGNVMRVQPLIAQMGPVPEDEVQRYLLK